MPVRQDHRCHRLRRNSGGRGRVRSCGQGRGGANRYDKIVAMIEESEKLKSGTENRALLLADRLVPWCLAGTVATYAFTRNVTRAISI